jgi:chromosome partitioning protein
MRILAISNHKGGVGKTTSALNISAAIARTGRRTLIIDLDPQANLSQSLHFVAEPGQSIYGALKGEVKLDDILVQQEEYLWLVPSEIDLSAAELEISDRPEREYILNKLLKNLNTKFDYVVIDCPPALSLLTINAFAAAQEVFLPLQAEYLAMQGLSRLVEVIEKVRGKLNPHLKVGGVFVTQFDKRKILNRNVVEIIKKHFGERLMNTNIRDNVALAEAPTMGKSVFDYAPRSYGAEDYENLAQEIIAQEK